MSNSCDISAHREKEAAKVNAFNYTDEEAELHAKEVDARPRPMETRNEIDEKGGFVRQANSFAVPVGDKEGEWATYDFSDKMRNLQLGIGAGVDWQPWTSIGVSADLNWGLTGIFKSSFKTVEQTLYPIYGTVSVFYRIR